MTQAHTPNRRKLPVLIILALTLIVAAVVVWRVENAPITDDAYAYADTIDVVPEVNGRILEMPIRYNQEVRQGELLFRIDPRPYQEALAASEARLITLNEQIKLTQRSVNVQQYNAESMNAIVKRSQALVAQATDTLNRRQNLLGKHYVSTEEVETARTSWRSAQAALLQAKQAEARRQRRRSPGRAACRSAGRHRHRQTEPGVHRG
ncbi:biotin/lipoyl-binding protein, partial [Serratia marcescens]|uniref:biotin/lipoyl-binding protein n=1 Tax=Serratia marcescens TaxID=615 RepID=UPI00237FAB2C